MKIETAVATSCGTSPNGTPGQLMSGRPPGTVPRSETPWEARSKPQLTAIEPTTAISAPGIFLFDRSAADDRRDHRRGDEDRRAARVRDVPEGGEELPDRAAVAVGDAEHPGDLAHRHLDADTGQEADQHRAREEVGEEAEPQQPRQEEEPGGDQREHPGERDVLRRAGRRHAGEAGGEDRRRRRVGADDEVPRRAEHREEGDRDEDRVEARDHGHPGDLRVAHDLGDADAASVRPAMTSGPNPFWPSGRTPSSIGDAEDAPAARAVRSRNCAGAHRPTLPGRRDRGIVLMGVNPRRAGYGALSRDETVMGFAFPEGVAELARRRGAREVPAAARVRAPLELGVRAPGGDRCRGDARARARRVVDGGAQVPRRGLLRRGVSQQARPLTPAAAANPRPCRQRSARRGRRPG